jgi:hypothetical protein
MTIKEMSVAIGEDICVVSKCIWGILGGEYQEYKKKYPPF